MRPVVGDAKQASAVGSRLVSKDASTSVWLEMARRSGAVSSRIDSLRTRRWPYSNFAASHEGGEEPTRETSAKEKEFLLQLEMPARE